MTGATKQLAARTPESLQNATLLLRPVALELFELRLHAIQASQTAWSINDLRNNAL